MRRLRTFLDCNFVLRNRAYKRLEEFFTKETKTLELGVGYNADADFFRSRVKSYTAADRKEYYETYSGSKIPEVVYYYGEKIPFKNNSFDLVLSIDCLEHIIPDKIKPYLDEIYRICKKNSNLPTGGG
jgi:ubiquinone/menaquinone biosynthesis C-methylase UbiE